MSKVDPKKLSRLDRRSTILLQAAREHTETLDEKGVLGVEDPGMDTLRGSFGAFGSIIRARTVKRLSQSSNRESRLRSRPVGAASPQVAGDASWMSIDGLGLKRHQLYDAPVPRADDEQSIHSHLVNKRPTIKFGEQDLVHSYSRPGIGDNSTRHEQRLARGSALPPDGYPPLPPLPRLSSPRPEANIFDTPIIKSSKPSQSSESSSLDWTETQTLLIPSHLTSESEVHSAPPTVPVHIPRTGRSTPRKDFQEMFDSNASLPTPRDRTTLLSFPSVTDSAPSEWSDEALKRKSTRESLRPGSKDGAGGKSRDSRPRTPKRYPGSADDKEETESLWRKTSSVEDESDSSQLPPEAGSVRLVQTKKQ